MIIFPKKNKIIDELNSYYIILPKLIEHYQGFLNSGCIFFRSPASEGIVYFDDENIINGVLIEKNKVLNGQQAIDLLLEASEFKNYSISIYDISQDFITYWANIYDAEYINKDLTLNFNELKNLFKKCSNEKLTGSVELKNEKSDYYIFFFLNGSMFLSSSNRNRFELVECDSLIKKINENESYTITVKAIPLNQKKFSINFSTNLLKKDNFIKEPVVVVPLNYIDMLQNLMLLYEKYFLGAKKNKDIFYTLLKKKFLEKVDKYEFLDPFSAEFKYLDGKILFTGKETHEKLSNSIIECLKEIANENNMMGWMKKHLVLFEEKYKNELTTLKINII